MLELKSSRTSALTNENSINTLVNHPSKCKYFVIILFDLFYLSFKIIISQLSIRDNEN